MVSGRFVFIQFLFCWFCKLGISQIVPKDHPLLVKELKKVYFDADFQNEQSIIANAVWNRDYYFPSSTQAGKIYFTLENSLLRLGPSFLNSKKSNTILPKGSMVWVLGMDKFYDSIPIENNQFIYFPYYKVYVPEIKKIAIVNGKLLPDFSISTRGYTNLDSTLPQCAENFQQYHSNFKHVPTNRDFKFDDDTAVDVHDFIENWIHQNDRVFQFYLRRIVDSGQSMVFLNTGTITHQNRLVIDVQRSTPYLGSPILPWIHGSRGLMGVRNVIEIEHWAESCGAEGGSTYFTYMENADPSMSLVKLGDFHSTIDAGVYSSSEILIFPTDTIRNYGYLNSIVNITGIANCLIQLNQTVENWENEWEFENEIVTADGSTMSPHIKSNSEIQYTKWNRNPLNFKKINITESNSDE